METFEFNNEDDFLNQLIEDGLDPDEECVVSERINDPDSEGNHLVRVVLIGTPVECVKYIMEHGLNHFEKGGTLYIDSKSEFAARVNHVH